MQQKYALSFALQYLITLVHVLSSAMTTLAPMAILITDNIRIRKI